MAFGRGFDQLEMTLGKYNFSYLAMPEVKSLLISIGLFSSPSAFAIVTVARIEETAMLICKGTSQNLIKGP